MHHKRKTQMVCNLHFPTRTTSEFEIWNRMALQKRKPYQLPGRMNISPNYCPGRDANPLTSCTPKHHNKQGVQHPTHLAIHVGNQCKQSKDLSDDLTQVYTNFMSILKCCFINPIMLPHVHVHYDPFCL